jgi:hypothetical protein
LGFWFENKPSGNPGSEPVLFCNCWCEYIDHYLSHQWLLRHLPRCKPCKISTWNRLKNWHIGTYMCFYLAA